MVNILTPRQAIRGRYTSLYGANKETGLDQPTSHETLRDAGFLFFSSRRPLRCKKRAERWAFCTQI